VDISKEAKIEQFTVNIEQFTVKLVYKLVDISKEAKIEQFGPKTELIHILLNS